MESHHFCITYQSRPARYDLNPDKVFEFVAGIVENIHEAKYTARLDNNFNGIIIANFVGSGRKLTLCTEARQFKFLEPFNLADLVMSGDSKKLTFNVYEHSHVAIPSEFLHSLAEKYSR